MANVCQISKKVSSNFKLWVGKGVANIDGFAISILKGNFGERISPDFARYCNL